jgi:6-phosphogluconolactonase
VHTIKEALIFNNHSAVVDFAVKKWMEISFKSVKEKGYFTVALSGGKTPAAFYDKLNNVGPLPWGETHIFLADERFVPLHRKDSNYFLIKKHLLDHIEIPGENIHPVSTEELTLEPAAQEYEDNIRNFFDIKEKEIPTFDLIMLGIGEDGHTASLFPGKSSLKESRRLVIPVFSDGFPRERITLTLPIINKARHIIFLVTGENKAGIIKEMLTDKVSALPASLVIPESGVLFLIIDRYAASLLPKSYFFQRNGGKSALGSPINKIA